MNGTVLVAVHDSPAAFAAADEAIAHARRTGAALRAVAVVEPAGAGEDRDGSVARGRAAGCEAALAHVVERAGAAGIVATVALRGGRIAAEILAEADSCEASLIVVGRMDRPGHVIPAIGSHTLGVIEFARSPVLVVPEDAPSAPRPRRPQ
ncbi:universal stress protein [Demequina sp. SYSU T00039]|uniref:Universal stress protein n=1 Tax=Demequina lignilytica TaxID=3051663 RepID=A0AAW7M855_9MICO|nr:MULTISPECIES: universal stress protein [unclassified Demequina]MDN4477516.1 universal stress protein [Demequina sp. SYSU T00039-1]MDN4488133.1 universal stress protein [Demequina sp. SYSU T00039]MDN4490574.1 universal stress protein [Demequina sp. SYSU T00068]